jgi:nucleoside-diphosphate-sugar epimerase
MAGVRTVLTGGTGVIGRAAVATLVDAGHDVAVVGDALDLASLEAAFEGADAVINLATSVPVGPTAVLSHAWRRHDRQRTTGVANVVEAARRVGVRRLVQESLSALYADQGDEWITEQSPVEVTSMTEPSAVGESLIQDYSCGSRVGVVLRFGTIVGDDRQTRQWLRATTSRQQSGGAECAGWAHVVHTDDLGGAVLAALHAPSGVYNVGAEPVGRRELVQGCAEGAGIDPGGVRRLGLRVARPRLDVLCRSLRVSSDHFSAQTGWRPLRPRFDAGWFGVGELHDARR